MASSIMTIRDAAEYLKLNYMTIYKLAQQGRIPASKIGGNWRLKKELLDDWIAESSRTFLRRFIIVAQDDGLREKLKEAFTKQGYKVAAVSGEEKALREIEKSRYDMVILDTALEADGAVSIMRAIKDKGDEINFALLFDRNGESVLKEALSLGPLLLVRKAFKDTDIKQLVQMIGPRR